MSALKKSQKPVRAGGKNGAPLGAEQTGPGPLLLRASRLLHDRASRTGDKTAAGLRVAHMTLLQQVSADGTRQTDLAQKLSVSKQAIGQLVSELTGLGFVKRDPDPADARATLVRLTAKGQKAQSGGQAVFDEVHGELEQKMGKAGVEKLESALGALIDALSAGDADLSE